MQSKIRRLATLAGTIGAFCACSSAMADAPVFEINPNALPGVTRYTQFATNQINATSSLLLRTVDNTNTGSGWVSFGSFSLAGNVLDAGDTGLGAQGGYRLYAKLSLSETYREGTGLPGQQHINGAGTFSDLTSLTFTLYADPTRNTTFTKANATSGANATVGGVTNDDIMLGFGTLIGGVTGYNEQGGAGINSRQTFALCSGAGTATLGGAAVSGGDLGALASGCTSGVGEEFFAKPDPFFNTAFTAFNNTRQGVIYNGNLISVNNAAGTIDFNVSPVPEPATYGMLGLGIAVVAVASRRRRNT